jgi:putative thioredoxin
VSDFMSRQSLAGAVDLSSLRKPEPTLGAAPAQGQPVAAETGSSNFSVPGLVAIGTEANLKNFLTISNSVPVVIDFCASWSEQSKELSPKLEKLVVAQKGRILLVKIDIEAEPKLAQAFQVNTAPTVVAVMKGQPVELFNGDQSLDSIVAVFSRLLEVAGENGMTGSVTVANAGEQMAAQAEPTLPPRHQAAFDAIDAGNYEEAIAQYEAALLESPADSLAKAGLAQAKLLLRTEGIDFEQVLTSNPTDLAQTLLKADACVAVGHAAEGYSTILTRFATADKADREALRLRLLELFEVSPPDAPELALARRQLAVLLY